MSKQSRMYVVFFQLTALLFIGGLFCTSSDSDTRGIGIGILALCLSGFVVFVVNALDEILQAVSKKDEKKTDTAEVPVASEQKAGGWFFPSKKPKPRFGLCLF